ncbi:hypothetical protein PV779_65490, partial [Streptomyces sp. ID01-9D]|nr:hypothetical protein [Streptomyces sp. ID01-9D]
MSTPENSRERLGRPAVGRPGRPDRPGPEPGVWPTGLIVTFQCLGSNPRTHPGTPIPAAPLRL